MVAKYCGCGQSVANSGAHYLTPQLGEDYDLVGVDPRGVGDSEYVGILYRAVWHSLTGLRRPRIQCFPQDFPYQDFIRNTVLENDFEVRANQSTEGARRSLRAQVEEANRIYKTQFEICENAMGKELRYMSTSTTARDIEYIATQLDGENASM